MGRVKENEIGRSLMRRLDAKTELAPMPIASTPEPARPTKLKKRERDGTHYVGCQISDDLFERLRVVAFETRREKQALMAEGIEHIVKKYGG